MKTRIGVLSLQGDFFEHQEAIKKIGAEPVQVRLPEQLESVHALIIPGGESTVIAKLMAGHGLDKKIKLLSKKGLPVFGTCAGAIVLAKKVVGEKKFKPLGLIDIVVKRNSYGRQIDSFEADLDAGKNGEQLKGVFIRAPEITKTGKAVEVLASLNKKPVFVRQKAVFASTFHPELTDSTKIHELIKKEAERFAQK